ncbi:hypothetical protein GGTG_12674 [Gaeumannomyces tritici R3-111a-1]|uniref:DUF8004 domain-containing protein n=1 Tax=Gaeumannomyces tritici (strain R3-111a-1) TaxID=644352 RepID=J3PGP5_GAET3|nr:hypothetical protein GGTG_12674 [Gaeumannomyces tritici R3-111a-1]EJT69791.1 hypothetical protein GGTG_12674 [Gaeumannomyces tritici R3-111a-1]
MMSTTNPGGRGPPAPGYSNSTDRPSCYKTKRFGEATNGRQLRLENVRRFDGAARADQPWDNLRRDPELWWNHGNCYVHLYAQGQSRRGPAFKVPFSTLQEQKCFPLIERFLDAWDQSDIPDRSPTSETSKEPRTFQLQPRTTPSALPDPIRRRMARGRMAGVTAARQPPDRWAGRVDLYIPAPPLADKRQALEHHLATRNFFAWAMGRSMVGEQLGRALATLLESMHEFREAGASNVEDLVAYMDEEGYLDFNGLPGNALAVLYLAENFRLGDLFIDSYVHCVGMSEILYRCPEYHNISSRSRRLIRKSRAEMDARLSSAGTMIRTFLEDDLSESRLGLTSGVRAHLDRFRAFVHSFYASKFGYYPPLPVDPGTEIFPAHIYRSMAQDFEALYSYLVDRSFTMTDSSPALAQGGICVLQSVEAFDCHYQFDSLHHPLPLLPKIGAKAGSSPSPSSIPDGGSTTTSPAPSTTSSRRRRWFSSAVAAAVSTTSRHQSSSLDKLRPDKKLVSHAALMTATNSTDVHLLENRFVCAYRRFEEDSVLAATTSNKFDRAEAKISLVDARKVRWILVYCMHQTLRACTATPAEVRCVSAGERQLPPYSLCVDTTELPPWEEQTISYESVEGDLLHVASEAIGSPPSVAPPALMLEIRPDVDYYAITHRDETRPPVSGSLSRSMSTFSASGALRPLTGSNNSIFKVPPRRSSLSSPSRPTTAAGDQNTGSLSRSASASSQFRKTLSKLRGGVASSASSFTDRPLTSTPLVPETFELPPRSIWRKSRRLSYREIFVQGYGNGTLDVMKVGDSTAPKKNGNVGKMTRPAGNTNKTAGSDDTSASRVPMDTAAYNDGEEEIPVKVAPEVVANRSASTSSNSSNSSTATKTSNATTAATSLASSVPSSPAHTAHGGLDPWDKIPGMAATVPEQQQQQQPSTPASTPPPADTATTAPSPVIELPTTPTPSPPPCPIPPRAPGRMFAAMAAAAAAAPTVPKRSAARRTWAGLPVSTETPLEDRLARAQRRISGPHIRFGPRLPAAAPSRSSSLQLRPQPQSQSQPLRPLRLVTMHSASVAPSLPSPARIETDISAAVAAAAAEAAAAITRVAPQPAAGCANCANCGAAVPRHSAATTTTTTTIDHPRRGNHPAARHSMGGTGYPPRRWTINGASRPISAIAEDGPDFQTAWDQFPELGGHRPLAAARSGVGAR